MADIIYGKIVSSNVKEAIRTEIENEHLEVGLAVIIVGNDPASHTYVNNKKKACEFCGIKSQQFTLPLETTEAELLALVARLNADKSVNGILVQSPLPKHINESLITYHILPIKDVDAFHPINVGKIMQGQYNFVPCTPAGIMELIHSTGVKVQGKNCVVIGRSNIVGKPMAMLLLHENGTVTMCHSKTQNLPEITLRADILVSAVGKAGFVTADMVKKGAVVIDVGMNRDKDGKLCGDVCFNEVEKVAGYITPVPGGVGPMTIAMLMKNTLKAYRLQNGQ